MTPEQIAKVEISEYLETLPNCTFWWQESVGVYDPQRRIFRKKKGKWQINGVSDICGIINGRPLYIEVKKPGSNRVSDSQKEFLERVTKHGAIAFVARSAEEVRYYLKLHKAI